MHYFSLCLFFAEFIPCLLALSTTSTSSSSKSSASGTISIVSLSSGSASLVSTSHTSSNPFEYSAISSSGYLSTSILSNVFSTTAFQSDISTLSGTSSNLTPSTTTSTSSTCSATASTTDPCPSSVDLSKVYPPDPKVYPYSDEEIQKCKDFEASLVGPNPTYNNEYGPIELPEFSKMAVHCDHLLELADNVQKIKDSIAANCSLFRYECAQEALAWYADQIPGLPAWLEEHKHDCNSPCDDPTYNDD